MTKTRKRKEAKFWLCPKRSSSNAGQRSRVSLSAAKSGGRSTSNSWVKSSSTPMRTANSSWQRSGKTSLKVWSPTTKAHSRTSSEAKEGAAFFCCTDPPGLARRSLRKPLVNSCRNRYSLWRLESWGPPSMNSKTNCATYSRWHVCGTLWSFWTKQTYFWRSVRTTTSSAMPWSEYSWDFSSTTTESCFWLPTVSRPSTKHSIAAFPLRCSTIRWATTELRFGTI